MNQDAFHSSRAPASATQRLAPRGTAPMPRAALGVADAELREKAHQLVAKLEPRIELLIRAGERAALPLPGVVVRPPRHPLRPNEDQVVGYLAELFGRDARLAQAVQVAIFRFQQVGVALMAETPLEQLRRHVFFLSSLPMELQGDPILTAIFPPPAARTGVAPATRAGAGFAAPTPDPRRAEAARREEALRKAAALGQALAPRIAIARLALETLDKGLGHNVANMMTPIGRQARLVAIALTTDKPAVARLREACAQYDALGAALPRIQAGLLDFEALRPIVLPLGQLGTTFREPPLVRDLFTRPLAAALTAAG